MADECKHEVTARDVSNVGWCVACGANMGIGYADWERPPQGEYMGIDRSMYGQTVPKKVNK